MTLLRPELVVLVPLAALLAATAVTAQWRRSRRLAEAYGGHQAARRLTGRELGRFPAARLAALILATSSLSVVGAGLQAERDTPPPPPTPVDLMIAVDVSYSMTGADVGSSRIARTRELVHAILEEGVADRVALTLFAGWPLELVPLTHDEAVVEFFTPWISPDLVTQRDQGTSLAALVTHAVATWQARPREGAIPVLLIVSDGEAHGTDRDVLAAVEGVADSIAVWTAGVGTEAGARLTAPASDDAPLLDEAGRPVVAGYDPALLREIAALGGGAFQDVSGDGGRRALVAELRRLGGEVGGAADPVADPAVWLVLLAGALLVLDGRLDRGARRRA